MSEDMLLLPSMMCADFGNLAGEVSSLEAAGVDGFHLDLMDGTFVPNFGMGLGDIRWVCRNASVPCDVHMMCVNPGAYVDLMAQAGAKVIYIHPEADAHPARTLARIADAGARPGIAVNPGTSVAAIEELLPMVSYVMAMTVNPGFAGQKWIRSVDRKIERLAKMGRSMGFDVVVDGNCSPQNVATAAGLGARGFVLGTAGLFGHGDYATSINALRSA